MVRLGAIHSRMGRIGALAMSLAVVALVATGCGSSGPSKQEAFKKDFVPINSHILQVNEEIVKTLTGKHGRSDAQFAAFMAVNAHAQRTIVSELKALDPPAALISHTKGLTVAATQVASDLETLSSATKARDLAAVRKAYKDLIKTSDKLRIQRRLLAQKTGAQVDP